MFFHWYLSCTALIRGEFGDRPGQDSQPAQHVMDLSDHGREHASWTHIFLCSGLYKMIPYDPKNQYSSSIHKRFLQTARLANSCYLLFMSWLWAFARTESTENLPYHALSAQEWSTLSESVHRNQDTLKTGLQNELIWTGCSGCVFPMYGFIRGCKRWMVDKFSTTG